MKLRIINTFFYSLLIFIFLIACKNNSTDMLHQKWKTVALVNTKMDQQIQEMQAYIDTLGKNDPEIRAAMNIDSAKMVLQASLNNSKEEQKVALENTQMEFKSNGVCYTTSIEGVDSAIYTIEGKIIKIDEAKLKGHGETMSFEILKLSKDSLQLKLVDYGDTTIATMIPIR